MKRLVLIFERLSLILGAVAAILAVSQYLLETEDRALQRRSLAVSAMKDCTEFLEITIEANKKNSEINFAGIVSLRDLAEICLLVHDDYKKITEFDAFEARFQRELNEMFLSRESN
jgi:hypothetical protein